MKTTLTLAAAFALMAGAAFAHAHLKTELPAAKSTVAAPETLVLHFSEDLSLTFSGIKVTGPAKAEVALGAGTLSDGETTLTVPVKGTLKPGTYTVDWHALSKDGHKTRGSYSFTVK